MCDVIASSPDLTLMSVASSLLVLGESPGSDTAGGGRCSSLLRAGGDARDGADRPLKRLALACCFELVSTATFAFRLARA